MGIVWWKAVAVWFGIALLAVANGVLRELFLNKKLGERYGHVLSTLLLSAVVFVVAFLSRRWIGIGSIGEAWLLGVVWVAMTLAFEFLAGHYVFGNPWEKILADYNVAKGRVWLLVPICTLFAPPMAFVGIESKWAVPYGASLAIASLIVLFAIGKPNVARWTFAVLFGYAGIYNTWLGSTHPSEYQNFADMVLIPWYAEFIRGPFHANESTFIVGIAIGQLATAAAWVLGKSWLRWGAFGVCAFLAGIAPFGVGSAFPFSAIVAFAAVIVASKLVAPLESKTA